MHLIDGQEIKQGWLNFHSGPWLISWLFYFLIIVVSYLFPGLYSAVFFSIFNRFSLFSIQISLQFSSKIVLCEIHSFCNDVVRGNRYYVHATFLHRFLQIYLAMLMSTTSFFLDLVVLCIRVLSSYSFLIQGVDLP